MSNQYVSAELRRHIAERANQCCEYCRTQAQYSADSFTADHITPRSLGGLTAIDNLALSCHGCNQHKATRTSASDPVTDLTVALFHPRQQRWEEHFAWNDDFTFMIGLTPIGRATIAALQLNRPGLVNLRRALYAIGEHPPESLNQK
ncbi:MAG: HNH endonuclease [Deltaproteobacteria bacterium]|nr:HNH endonuclease [Deltaproteobacteria bacterium]